MTTDDAGLSPTRGEHVTEIVATLSNLVPYAGGAIADAISMMVRERQSRRLQAFSENLVQDLESVKSRLEPPTTDEEAIKDFVELTFVRVGGAAQKEQLKAYRALFINTLLDNPPNYDEPTEIIELLSRWQDRHIVLLRILANPLQADREAGNPVGPGSDYGTTSIGSILSALVSAWSADQIDRSWQDLYDAHVVNTESTRFTMTDRGIHQLENRLTDHGRRIVHFLRDVTD